MQVLINYKDWVVLRATLTHVVYAVHLRLVLHYSFALRFYYLLFLLLP